MLAVDTVDRVDRAAAVLVEELKKVAVLDEELSRDTVAVLDEESYMGRRCWLLTRWTGYIELRRCWTKS